MWKRQPVSRELHEHILTASFPRSGPICVIEHLGSPKELKDRKVVTVNLSQIISAWWNTDDQS